MTNSNACSIEELQPAKNAVTSLPIKHSVIRIKSHFRHQLRASRTISPDEVAAGYPTPSIPDGTYGWSGRTLIWAWGDGVGLRFVKLRWWSDLVLITACGKRNDWSGRAFGQDTLSGRQLEYCLGDYGIGYIAAYVGETMVLKGQLMGNSSLIEVDPEVNYESKWFGFC